MAFDGSEGAPIELTLAQEWTSNYRKTKNPDSTRAIFVGRDIIEEILQQDECVGIRYYFAEDDQGQAKLILVGAKPDESDIIPGIIADYGKPCPHCCDAASPLASTTPPKS